MELTLPIKMLLSLFPLGSLAAVVVWFVYVGKYGHDGNAVDAENRNNKDKASIAFEAAIASVALYFILHHNVRHLM